MEAMMEMFEDFFEEVVNDENAYDSMICTHNCD